ncbi:phBC6A51 family helix-turn-helix protein [Salimicrobium halophilum]|uniref:Helix-turn-helix domain-containing protein n=1 Tax=Salimicrobium halophilum TaxID=86666 RepID=A0A1G8WFJ8_9BACI|nr:phBC6A51 family helix-turn-helix protein [Salimicrobium halophilum]SDJ76485.1 Helix-turn-helix domain-containing protein [Salimicrobium halophilum]
MLDERQMRAIEYVAEGQLNRSDIAKRVGISRPTLYKWLDDDEFVSEVNSRLQKERGLAEKKIDAKLDFAVGKLYEIAQDNSNRRVQADVLKYLVDRSLGKPTTKLDLDASLNDEKNVEADVLDQEFQEYESNE